LSESDWGDDEAEEEARDEFLVDKEKALQIEEPLDAHGEQVGGTLASATLGIIKGKHIFSCNCNMISFISIMSKYLNM
jgi:hypothetical protein